MLFDNNCGAGRYDIALLFLLHVYAAFRQIFLQSLHLCFLVGPDGSFGPIVA